MILPEIGVLTYHIEYDIVYALKASVYERGTAMITLLGKHQGYAVVEQDIEGAATLHVIADEGRGQWDVFPLIGCRTFEQARIAIDRYIAFEAAMSQPEDDVDIDLDAAAGLI